MKTQHHARRLRRCIVAAAVATVAAPATAGPAIMPWTFTEDIDNRLITAQDPSETIVVNPLFTGVGMLQVGNSVCTGALLNNRQALTAAHCFGDGVGDGSLTNVVTDGVVFALGNSIIDEEMQQVIFDAVVDVETVDINPLWLGPTGGVTGPAGDGDIAVVTFTERVVGFESYGVLLEDDFREFFIPHVRVGRGTFGPLGDPSDRDFDFNRRLGFNEYEAIWTGSGLAPASRAVYDCDSGDPADDLIGTFTTSTLGVFFENELVEACAGPGDSGSGNFILDEGGELIIAAVTSFGSIETTFGGFGGDTRTAAHADFLREVVFGIPVPPAAALFAVGVLASAGLTRRSRR